ncbi:amidase [Rubellimicrobium roseum]|uniref:Amidase n=1 Tax=Rubellimicrobium roseum TaxID=687525 RepID=A0A5C4N6Q5_9RHOB|nr:amidase [Rubellimicrobium roseum]TNC61384.1 amidase [Rubellimicrobium roseum]
MSAELRDVPALGAAFRAGTLTPREVVEAALARIAETEPILNAFADPMAESARAEADLAGEALRAGLDLGPLHGIPVAIKDLIEVAGAPTGWGTKVESPRVATTDAPLVARLRAAGAVILGKTNCLEYAYGVPHPEIGQTNNPHDLSRTAGGSSGGSAAAVAAGIVPLSVGTDTGGSIRIPAAYCGIVGLKPSYGLVPLDGVFPLSWSLDHAGPLARSVGDARLLFSAMSGRDMAAPTPGRMRLGVLRRHWPREDVNREVGARVDQALEQLGAAGFEVREIDLPGLGAANATLVDILKPEASVIHRDLLARNAAGYAPGTRAQIEAGFEVPATAYVEAMRLRARLRAEVEAMFAEVDALVSPAVPFVAPHEDPPISGENHDDEMLASGFANLTGHPALSLPCGQVGGLPVGLQLVGSFGGDARLLALAEVCEGALSGQNE